MVILLSIISLDAVGLIGDVVGPTVDAVGLIDDVVATLGDAVANVLFTEWTKPHSELGVFKV